MVHELLPFSRPLYYAKGPSQIRAMHVLLITSHLLHASVLNTALKNANISTSVATPLNLSRYWIPEMDAIFFPHPFAKEEMNPVLNFLSNFSKKIPLIFLGAYQKSFFQEKRTKMYMAQSIFLDENLPLSEIPFLIRDVLQKNPKKERELTLGNLSIDRLHRTLRIGDQAAVLSKKEFYLLELLILNSGQITTRENIIDYVWDKRDYVAPNTIDVYVSRLRKKLTPGFIRTFPSLGYQVNL